MKKLLLILLTCSAFSVFAQTDKKVEAKKEVSAKEIPELKKGEAEPCLETADAVMKKLEEEKRKRESKGLGLSLQGNNNTGGCSL